MVSVTGGSGRSVELLVILIEKSVRNYWLFYCLFFSLTSFTSYANFYSNNWLLVVASISG